MPRLSSSVEPTVLTPSSGMILTVGSGMEFATLADALRAAVDGDTIAVKAGTYTNDFGTVTANVSIVAIGGMVNEVATVPAPNGKGLLTVDANLNIQGLSFTGGGAGTHYGNIAGIRLEAGNLNISYCYFHDMDEGLLANPDPTARVTIDHSEFAHNGAGDGYSHNIYVGAVASLTVTNCYLHDANIGHELKSRAALTIISNNVIADGPNGTASYDIDVPNCGVVKITNNIIEKGPKASNSYAIHYGGETQYAWANNSLDITGNTLLNDLPVGGFAVLNHAAVNGLSTAANIADDRFYGFDAGRLIYGAGTITRATMLTVEPQYSTAHPWAGAPLVGLAGGPELLTLSNTRHTVAGGAGHLTVNDSAGGNTIAGGAGGLTVNMTGAYDVITTLAHASDTLNLAAGGATVTSAGNDSILTTGQYEQVSVSGAASIAAASFSTFILGGAGEHLLATHACVVDATAAAAATVTGTAGDIRLFAASGARLNLIDLASSPGGGGAATASVSGGGVDGWVFGTGGIALTTGAVGARIQAGTGSVSVTGGAGADTLVAGSGGDTFVLGGGADQVFFGGGTASVTGGTGAETYNFASGAHGADTIGGFKLAVDQLHMTGFTGQAIVGGVVTGAGTLLTLADGTTIDLVNVVLPGYGGGPGGGGPGGGGMGGGAGGGGAGGMVLTSGGHDVVGGATLLTVTDEVGGNTIVGGSGGLAATAASGDVVGTAAGAANQVVLSRYDTLTGAGTDQVSVTANDNTITEAGIASIALAGTGNTVQGGAGLLSVADVMGGNSVGGGAGGLAANLAIGDESVSTAANATDTIGLGGRDTLLSRGADTIAVSGLYNQVTVLGAATVTAGAGFSSFDLEGTDSLVIGGAGLVTVGHAAVATIGSAGKDMVAVVKQAGGVATISEMLPEGLSSLSARGGAATISAAQAGPYQGLAAFTAGGADLAVGTGSLLVVSTAAAGGAADSITGGIGSLTAYSGPGGLSVVAGAGNITLTGGIGDDQFVGGTGAALLNLGAGADTITLGAGSITVFGGGHDSFLVPQGARGTLVVQNWSAQDTLSTPGQAALSITADSVVGGNTWLTLAGGAQIELVGVTHFT